MSDGGGEQGGSMAQQWSKNEDSQLKSLVVQYGEHWDVIGRHLGNRTEEQIQHRWHKFHNPTIKGPWTREVCFCYSHQLFSLILLLIRPIIWYILVIMIIVWVMLLLLSLH